jgi:hypothetical protein
MGYREMADHPRAAGTFGARAECSVQSRRALDRNRQRRFTSVTFAADGKSIITASEDGLIRAHACIPCASDEELLQRARRSVSRVIESHTLAAPR